MKSIVITTIAKPNRCLKSMARNIKGNFKLIIIGDKKSPKVFLLKNALYFSVDAQKKLNFKFTINNLFILQCLFHNIIHYPINSPPPPLTIFLSASGRSL